MRTAPYFFDTFPKTRRPDYPRFKGDGRATLVIVGGGLTGCASALACAASGVRIVLLEADRIGRGMTAGSVGLLRQSFDASFQETATRHGLRTARHLWAAMRRASLDFAAALRRFGIRADLSDQDLLYFTRNGPDAERRLKREYQARRDAGLDLTWLNKAALRRESAIDADGALRTEGMALDPYRACVGFAAAAEARGATALSRRREATGGCSAPANSTRSSFIQRSTCAGVSVSRSAAARRPASRRTAAGICSVTTA
jgi:glycine/D-amino acid oxidase-like deaminating enzyme